MIHPSTIPKFYHSDNNLLDESKLWSFPLCNYVYLRVASFVLDSNTELPEKQN
jgi:hypothetical protein